MAAVYQTPRTLHQKHSAWFVTAGEIAHEDADADRVPGKKAIRSREPFEVPTGGAFWLHDDRFGGEAEQEPAEEAKDE